MRGSGSAVWMLMAGLGLAACDGGGGDDGGGGGGGGGPADAGPPDAAPAVDAAVGPDASAEDQLATFCRRAAEARCAWATDCLGARPERDTVLGLGGDAAACAERAAAPCLADVADRFARGTIEFTPGAVDACLRATERAPCDERTPPAEWVRDWRKYVHDRCAPVVPGTVLAGDACRTRTDCRDLDQICEATCRDARPADLLRACDATGAGTGALNPDEGCAGEVCVQVGPNQDDKTGLCTIDCRDGRGCPGGSYCLQLTPPGGSPAFFCTKPCTEDRDCGEFACVRVNPFGDESRHCWVRAR